MPKIATPITDETNTIIAGVDEVGRGPLAGPVTVAAVILDPANTPTGLNDSKKLTERQRDILFEAIMLSACAVAIIHLAPSEIDRLNIRGATLEAMRRSILSLSITPDFALIDGRDVPPELPCPARAIIGGDGLEPAISAASIVAKVARDRLMIRLDQAYPAYGFARHKGYGSATHMAAIREFGPCPHHRRTFAPFKNGTP